MMFLLLLILILNVNNNYSFINKNSNTFLSFHFPNHYFKINVKSNDKSNDGYDHRFPLKTNKSETEEKLYNISQLFKKKDILNLLTNENISIYTKIGILKENVIYSPNIFAGGLMKDFDFEYF